MGPHIRRLEDWPTRLSDLIRDAEGRPFSWGDFDCCLFAADAIEAMTGIDPAAGLRRYKTEFGAYRVIRLETGGGDVSDIVGKVCADCGFEKIPPIYAQRGDVAVVDADGGETAGVVDMSGAFIAAPSIHGGLARRHIENATAAWKVP